MLDGNTRAEIEHDIQQSRIDAVWERNEKAAREEFMDELFTLPSKSRGRYDVVSLIEVVGDKTLLELIPLPQLISLFSQRDSAELGNRILMSSEKSAEGIIDRDPDYLSAKIWRKEHE